MVGNGRFRKFYKSTKISKSGALGVGWEKESCCHALREPGHTRISIGVYVPSQAVETRLNATLI